jgi:hypothetical protein
LSSGATNQAPVLEQQSADDGTWSPFFDVDDAALGPAPLVEARHANAHAVAVQGGSHLAGWHEHIGAARGVQYKAVSVAMPLQRAGEFFQQARHLDVVGAFQLSFFDDIVLLLR